MKKIFAIASAVLALGLGLAACNGSKSSDRERAQAEADSLAEVARQDSIALARAMVAAPFVGTYEGDIPAADAAGLHVVLVINSDATYACTQTAADEEATVMEDKGMISIDEAGLIVLESEVNEATEAAPYVRLQTDEEGNMVIVNADGTMPEDVKAYTLVKKVEETEEAATEE
jgi:copper homeostasis protein (lipoprotein)